MSESKLEALTEIPLVESEFTFSPSPQRREETEDSKVEDDEANSDV